MENSWQFNLTPGFAQQLMDDGFQYVGHYEILEGNVCKIRVDKEAGRWRFSVYTHVSYADGGKHVRIGKSEGLLRDRLNSWPRYIGNALKFTMRKNQQFKGGTPPWEAQGWVEYTVRYGGRGLLFAQHVENLPTLEATKKALRHLEKQLQDFYDPLCVMIQLRAASFEING